MERDVDTDTARTGRLRWQGRRRLPADTQVLMGVGGLLALLAVAVGVAVFLIVALEDDASDLSRRHVQYASAVHEAALSAKAMANEQRGFLLSGDDQYLRQFEADATDVHLAFAVAASNAVGESHRVALDKADLGFERWLTAVRADIAAYQEGSRQQAIEASLGATRELRKTYEQSLADAYALGVRSISDATDSLSTSASRSVIVLLAYLALALVIGAAVAFWVVRVILRPAFVLSRNAIDVLTRGRMLVAEDERGSHYGVAVQVPVEVVNALAESALAARQVLRPDSHPEA